MNLFKGPAVRRPCALACALGAGLFFVSAMSVPAAAGAANVWAQLPQDAGAPTYSTVTTLGSGKVLLAGGQSTFVLASAQLFDPDQSASPGPGVGRRGSAGPRPAIAASPSGCDTAWHCSLSGLTSG